MKKLFLLLTGLLLGIFITVNAFGFLGGDFIYRELKYPHLYQNLFSLQDTSKNLDKIHKAEQLYGWEKVSLQSPYGYTLRGTFIPDPDTSANTVIILHGIFQNRSAGVDYYRIYQQLGYNVLLVDARAHGESGGSSISWGYFEKADVGAWTDWLKKRYPNGKIGIHGISMGAATAALHSSLSTDKNVSFYIIDSAYDDFQGLLVHQLKLLSSMPQNTLLPDIVMFYVQAAAYYEDRITYDELSPRLAIAKSTKPMLFLHGESDTLIPPAMSTSLYNAAKGIKELHTLPNTPHASGIYKDRRSYSRTIQEFVQKLQL